MKTTSAPVVLTAILSTLTAAADKAPALKAEIKDGRVLIHADGGLFTAYEFGGDLKYPQFFPVNGPRSGKSVTTRRTEPFPHHSSLFFACDHVNGGNYWQEGPERGRIVSKDVRIVRDSGKEVVFEQDSRWERQGAEPPFADSRKITVSAPSPDERVIDFDVTLTALMEVTIRKNNHSLFAARMAPDLAPIGGGTMVNSRGQSGDKEIFGTPAAWMDARGTRDGVTEGLVIYNHPANPWTPVPWFTREYGFFSPTPMFWLERPFVMQKGETLRLRYRVLVHASSPDAAAIGKHAPGSE